MLVPSELVRGAKSLRAQQYADAYRTLEAELKRVKGPYANGYEYGDVILPYVAYAAAHLPEVSAKAWQKADYRAVPPVEAGFLYGFHRSLNGKGNFDFELASAFRAGLAGKHDQAVRHLKTAFNYMPRAKVRIVHPAYQWAEACEWLYRDTGQAVYRTMALDWVTRYQEVVPYLSWPYAIEATLSDNKPGRVRATSFVQQLDPLSARLARLPDDLKREAARADIRLPWQ